MPTIYKIFNELLLDVASKSKGITAEEFKKQPNYQEKLNYEDVAKFVDAAFGYDITEKKIIEKYNLDFAEY